MRCLLCILALVLVSGCRSQTTAMTNPFMAPDRVPPPATRTLLPGTAQPYYPGDPVPNSPAIGAPPVGYSPGFQQATPTYAPQSDGTLPPDGWNSAPQPIPSGSSSYNALPNSIQPASAVVPLTVQPQIQVQPDQQSLRFYLPAPLSQPQQQRSPQQSTSSTSVAAWADPSVLPTPQQSVSPYPNQFASYQAPTAQPKYLQQSVAPSEPREVRIRAVSSTPMNFNDGQSVSSDGFRPQGSSQVRKPTIASRLVPRKRQPIGGSSNHYGFDPQFGWLRGALQYSSQQGLWSLQYVPGQGSADQFGGSLTIANPQVLGDLQPGDYVQLSGRVEQSLPGGMPVYRVSVVRRQRI